MNRFVEVLPLALTPLTPIHIGCGEDFEPTNYVIDGGVLYHFDPTRLALTPRDRQRLIECANERADAAIRAVQQFFHAKRSDCRQASRLAVPVAPGIAEWYGRRVGQVVQHEAGGRTVSSQLEIERTAFHPHTDKPYLPGSSLKGSMRTGWLNDLDKGSPARRDPHERPTENSLALETALLGGSFSSDPFRLVSVVDSSGTDVQTRVVFAIDRRKPPRPDSREKDLFVRREALCGGQLRALQGEVRFRSMLQPGAKSLCRRTAAARHAACPRGRDFFASNGAGRAGPRSAAADRLRIAARLRASADSGRGGRW
jgi:CRISPR-associated protein Csm5